MESFFTWILPVILFMAIIIFFVYITISLNKEIKACKKTVLEYDQFLLNKYQGVLRCMNPRVYRISNNNKEWNPLMSAFYVSDYQYLIKGNINHKEVEIYDRFSMSSANSNMESRHQNLSMQGIMIQTYNPEFSQSDFAIVSSNEKELCSRYKFALSKNQYYQIKNDYDLLLYTRILNDVNTGKFVYYYQSIQQILSGLPNIKGLCLFINHGFTQIIIQEQKKSFLCLKQSVYTLEDCVLGANPKISLHDRWEIISKII